MSRAVKLSFGIGQIAEGIKSCSFGAFLMFYYNQVLGLPASLAGTAILIAMIFDAISDPLVGVWSDNTHSRWGRRHPFMYAAAIPVALFYSLLWRPPDWDDGALFLYLVVLAVLIRTLITFFETPSSALMPELTAKISP